MNHNDIEQTLSALKPAEQPMLARQILAIPQQKKQRRRDCIVGFGGLLTGIACTVLVMMLLAEPKADSPIVVQYVAAVDNVKIPETKVAEVETVVTQYSQEQPDALDAMIARYEKMLQIRSDWARQQVVITPRVLSDSGGALEYRNKLLTTMMEP